MKKIFLYTKILILFNLILSGCSTAHIYTSDNDSSKKISANMFNPRNIAIFLPFTGSMGALGLSFFEGFMTNYYKQPSSARPTIHVYDIAQMQLKRALKLTALQNTDFIIGPFSYDLVKEATENVEVNIPWLMLNYTDTELKPNIYQFGFSYQHELIYALRNIWDAGYRHPLLIYDNSNLGKRAPQFFKDFWEQMGGTLTSTLKLTDENINTKTIEHALLVDENRERVQQIKQVILRNFKHPIRRRQDIDMIFLITNGYTARQVKPILNYYLTKNIPVFSLSYIYTGETKWSSHDMDGIYFTSMPWQNHENTVKKRKHFEYKKNNNDEHSNQLERLFVLGLDICTLYPYLHMMEANKKVDISNLLGLHSMTDRKIEHQFNWSLIQNGKSFVTKYIPSNKTPKKL